MSERNFVHLHLHTQYSLLDGAIRIGPLVDRVTELGMSAVAMTDHGNMYGAVEFFKACKRKGVKPIIGTELNLAPEEGLETDGKRHHLTVLARDNAGYKNLMRLSSMTHLEGWKNSFPHATYEMLERYREGLIVLSGDLGGEIPQAILAGKPEKAREKALYYRDLFEEGCFFLEIMHNKFPEQARVNDALIELSAELDIPLVATNDCHYLSREEAHAHAILMCIQLGKSVELDVATSHGIDDFYLKSADEMWEAFAHVPEACENALRIADMIDVEIPLGQVFLPRFRVPEDFMQEHGFTDLEEAIPPYFQHLSREGLEERFKELDARDLDYEQDAYWDRLDIEMGIIIQMDFPGYFLIVWDFINWARRAGVPVGPGRGSGAGSLVAYSLGITNINPMEYGLLFERFLNPERVSMPDFDIDFCMNRRGEVIDYVTEKYGQDNVGQIVTYGSLKAKGCIKDVGRALNFNYSETDRIAKLVPDELGITLSSALEKEPKLREMVAEDERARQLFDIALQLEGLYRQVGMHAAGVVISEEPLWEYVPVCRGAGDEYVAQFAKNEVEEAGLVKFDFLGLKTLTVLEIACRLVNDTHRLEGKPPFDLDAIPMDDQLVFDLISRGQTTGVFQLESSGFQELMQKLKPNCFEDIIAAVALYRPGPLGSGMVDDFVLRKHGLKAVEYPHPWTDKILEETYGVIVYQEQVMQIAQRLAGFSLGAADIMRRAMGKKKVKEMKKQRQYFMDGAAENGLDPEMAGEIFDLIEYFAGYGFNKSHSAAYGLITYQTGWLKAHYPVEFTAALLTCDRENTAKVVRTIYDARTNMGVEVLPPDVNLSVLDFSVRSGKIRFGLGAVKGVGEGAIEAILEAREEEGDFESIFDFCERVDLKRVNKRVLEALVKCGAFDALWDEPLDNIRQIGRARARLFGVIGKAVDRGQKTQADKEAGQTSLFDLFAAKAPAVAEESEALQASYPDVDPWSDKILLAYEKATIGFYVTGHPLDRYAEEINRYATADTSTLPSCPPYEMQTVAGVVSELREKTLKSGDGRMAFITLEDRLGEIEVLCFRKMYAVYEEVLKSDEALLFKGRVTVDGDGENKTFKLRADEAELLTTVRQRAVKHFLVQLEAEDADPEKLHELMQIFEAHPGHCKAYLRLIYPQLGRATVKIPEHLRIAPTDDFLIAVENLFTQSIIKLR